MGNISDDNARETYNTMKQIAYYALHQMYETAKEHAPAMLEQLTEAIANFKENVTHSEARATLNEELEKARTNLEFLRDNLDSKSFENFKYEIEKLGTFNAASYPCDLVTLTNLNETMTNLNSRAALNERINPDVIGRHFNLNNVTKDALEGKSEFIKKIQLKASSLSAEKNIFKQFSKAKDLEYDELTR